MSIARNRFRPSRVTCRPRRRGRTRTGADGARQTGFTLIELLVVIAIIALLVSILVPSLASARFLSRVVSCQVNLRNCGLAAQSYAADNRACYYSGPAWRGWQAVYYLNPNPPWWPEWDLRPYVEDYVGDYGIWACPALGQQVMPSIAELPKPPNNRVSNYVYYPNWGEGIVYFGSTTAQPDRDSEVTHPARQVIQQDRTVWGEGFGWGYANHGTGGDRVGSFEQIHSANLLFYDGHTECVRNGRLEPVGWPDINWPSLQSYAIMP